MEGKEQSWNGQVGEGARQGSTSSSCCSLRRTASASHWHNPLGVALPQVQQQQAWSSHTAAGARALAIAGPVHTVDVLLASEYSKCFISLFFLYCLSAVKDDFRVAGELQGIAFLWVRESSTQGYRTISPASSLSSTRFMGSKAVPPVSSSRQGES